MVLSRGFQEGKEIVKQTDIKKMTDEQLIKHYYKHEACDFLEAGLACGELTIVRGYDILEDSDEPVRFVKKEKKVA